MVQVSVGTFHHKGVILIMDVVIILFRIDYILLSLISICAVIFHLKSSVNNPLNCPGYFVLAYHMSHDLLWLSAHHGHNVDIFPGFCAGFVLQQPVKPVQFHNLHTCCGFFSPSSDWPFLSNSPHWICLFPVSSLHHGCLFHHSTFWSPVLWFLPDTHVVSGLLCIICRTPYACSVDFPMCCTLPWFASHISGILSTPLLFAFS